MVIVIFIVCDNNFISVMNGVVFLLKKFNLNVFDIFSNLNIVNGVMKSFGDKIVSIG